MEYTPNPELEKLRTEKEQNEKKVEQLTHKITRYENRQKYYEDGERKRRTHRLCTIAGTLERDRHNFGVVVCLPRRAHIRGVEHTRIEVRP